ncbi:MAG: hypothetical protein J5668_03025 [Bacteroidales bacterium]|nr:hypothetical protein [Bacteroidales bacterium]
MTNKNGEFVRGRGKKRIMTNRKGLFVRGKNVKKERYKGGICKERKDDELVKNC